MTFEENIASLRAIDALEGIDLYKDGCAVGKVPNIDGKRASLKILAHVVDFDNGSIDYSRAQQCLALFAELSDDAREHPGKHPTIDVLLSIKEHEILKAVVHYAVPETLCDQVEKFSEMKRAGTLMNEKAAALKTFNEIMDLLEAGVLRTAQLIDGSWQSLCWVKEGILLGFPLGNIVTYQGGNDIQFSDKETFPLRKIAVDSGIRVVPPASGLRRGAYAGTGCVFMPPAYANVGAHIGGGSMIENLAGSCCQVGRDCHISAGAIIGGVLDPIEATPVIIGDNVLLGEGSGVTQGCRLGDLVTLVPGVHLSKATPVMDPLNGVAYSNKGTHELIEYRMGDAKLYGLGTLLSPKDSSYGPEIPRGALVIPGLSMSSLGAPKLTPVVVKYIKNPSERAYALEEALRN